MTRTPAILGGVLVLLATGLHPWETVRAGAAQVYVVRPPAVAGQFYPGETPALTSAIAALLAAAPVVHAGDPVALVVPHAGYAFSGQVAADGFRQVQSGRYDTVVIIGTNHTTPGFRKVSVYEGDAWRTPLGIVAVDRDLAAALVKDTSDAVFDTTLHAREHSVEVQVPFVQRLFPEARVLPLVVGTPDPAMCARVGRALAKLVKGRRVLIVASSDLSHYPGDADAARIDRRTLDAIASMDTDGLHAAEATVADGGVPNLVTIACGEGAIIVAVEAARTLGANRGTVVSYANSADSPMGDPARVVGYGAVLLSRGERGSDTSALQRPSPDPSGSLGPDDKRLLLRLARDTIRQYLESATVPLPRGGSSKLLRQAGAFVTLRLRGELRGCIGRLVPDRRLLPLVAAMALESAFNDPRFTPARAGDLKAMEIEVSVLTPMKPVNGPGDIVVGRDGVVLKVGDRSAVFLPQVAGEQGWNREQLLDNLCQKAGLPPRAWRGSDAKFLTFQADVFKESDYR